jgi:hypothetical protein
MIEYDVTTAPEPGPTPRQIEFIESLRAERALTPADVAWLDSNPPTTKARASEIITSLLAAPKTPTAVAAASPANVSRSRYPSPELLPEGRYALPEQAGAQITFWRVDRPAEGRWAGYVFVKACYGSPGSLRYERVDTRSGIEVAARIAEYGAERASKLFGTELGTCGVCGSPLTNRESRELGIGPVCRAKVGW